MQILTQRVIRVCKLLEIRILRNVAVSVENFIQSFFYVPRTRFTQGLLVSMLFERLYVASALGQRCYIPDPCNSNSPILVHLDTDPKWKFNLVVFIGNGGNLVRLVTVYPCPPSNPPSSWFYFTTPSLFCQNFLVLFNGQFQYKIGRFD